MTSLGLVSARREPYDADVIIVGGGPVGDLAAVAHMSDRVAVMTSGHIVETGPAVEIYERPQHEYTRTLLAAIPADTPAEARRRRADAQQPSPR